MMLDARKFAVATAGFCAFLNLYSPQALLPALAREFGTGAAAISTIMTASTLAIALTAPFTGAIADVLGRKRVITAAMLAVVLPMAGAALAQDVQALIAWRFVQGLLLPPIFAVTIAYIGDEWPAHEVAAVAGIYIAGSSIGGFCRPAGAGRARRSRRLARRVSGAGGAVAGRSARGGAAAATRKALRALGGPCAPRRGRCCGT